MADALLALDDVRAGYGDAVVLDCLTFDIPDGGSLALLGRNGVGKSTLLLTIMGFTRVSRGRIAWRGRDLARIAPHRRARASGAPAAAATCPAASSRCWRSRARS